MASKLPRLNISLCGWEKQSNWSVSLSGPPFTQNPTFTKVSDTNTTKICQEKCSACKSVQIWLMKVALTNRRLSTHQLELLPLLNNKKQQDMFGNEMNKTFRNTGRNRPVVNFAFERTGDQHF